MQKMLSKKASLKPNNRSERGDFFIAQDGWLQLADGQRFSGVINHLSSKNQLLGFGEVVFTTGMNGYIESLTDPSYAGQILVFTYPLIGNYGVDENYFESAKVQPAGVIVSTAETDWSHSQSQKSIHQWLRENNVPFMSGADTRAITKYLRSRGTTAGAFTTSVRKIKLPKIAQHFVTIDKPRVYNSAGKKTIILVDCGLKENILRNLVASKHRVLRVPSDYDYTKEKYDGIVVANGPGNPANYKQTIANIKKAMRGHKPIFGICLGSQLMARAVGAKTYKLKFGHRGHNQPCLIREGNRAYITSQNHGYAVRANSLPKNWRILFTNLNDGSVEGIEHISKPFFAVQFHPEAAPGPTDTKWLFERFFTSL